MFKTTAVSIKDQPQILIQTLVKQKPFSQFFVNEEGSKQTNNGWKPSQAKGVDKPTKMGLLEASIVPLQCCVKALFEMKFVQTYILKVSRLHYLFWPNATTGQCLFRLPSVLCMHGYIYIYIYKYTHSIGNIYLVGFRIMHIHTIFRFEYYCV